MRFNLDGLEVFFPYERVYLEQYQYMKALKLSLDARGHALLEMPTGTGMYFSFIDIFSRIIVVMKKMLLLLELVIVECSVLYIVVNLIYTNFPRTVYPEVVSCSENCYNERCCCC